MDLELVTTCANWAKIEWCNERIKFCFCCAV